jgi:5-formyltetrahydrofolate cyclo-ligase
MAADKRYFRNIISDCRSALTRAYAESVSRRVEVRFLESAPYREASTVVLYAAKDNEVSTDLLLDDALRSGRRVLLPKVVPETRELLLIRLWNRAELALGAFGLLEPTGTESVRIADLGSALFCLPGVAFSRIGQRLGRGGGYFDRALANAGPKTITAGLAYSFQLLDWLPESTNDRRLDLIFTESAMHVVGERGSGMAERSSPAVPCGS